MNERELGVKSFLILNRSRPLAFLTKISSAGAANTRKRKLSMATTC